MGGHPTPRAARSRDRARPASPPPLGPPARRLLQRRPPAHEPRRGRARHARARAEGVREGRRAPSCRWASPSLRPESSVIAWRSDVFFATTAGRSAIRNRFLMTPFGSPALARGTRRTRPLAARSHGRTRRRLAASAMCSVAATCDGEILPFARSSWGRPRFASARACAQRSPMVRSHRVSLVQEATRRFALAFLGACVAGTSCDASHSPKATEQSGLEAPASSRAKQLPPPQTPMPLPGRRLWLHRHEARTRRSESIG